MRTHTSEHGFTLMELLASTAISLVVIGTAMTAFKDGVGMTKSASNRRTTQNLRSGTNMLIHDLVLAGRGIPTGGISIPSGADSAADSAAESSRTCVTFDNVGATSMTAITTGSNKGPAVDGQTTDMVTIVSLDPILDTCLLAPLSVRAWNDAAGVNLPHMNNQNGTSFTVVNIANVKCPDGLGGFNGDWLAGNPHAGANHERRSADVHGRERRERDSDRDEHRPDERVLRAERERPVRLQPAGCRGRVDQAIWSERSMSSA